jgi:hypothetical protein
MIIRPRFVTSFVFIGVLLFENCVQWEGNTPFLPVGNLNNPHALCQQRPLVLKGTAIRCRNLTYATELEAALSAKASEPGSNL